jgi:hypothetical protein
MELVSWLVSQLGFTTAERISIIQLQSFSLFLGMK